MGRLIGDQSLAVVPGVALVAQDSQVGRLRGALRPVLMARSGLPPGLVDTQDMTADAAVVAIITSLMIGYYFACWARIHDRGSDLLPLVAA
jgi:hypothetical protein